MARIPQTKVTMLQTITQMDAFVITGGTDWIFIKF